MPVYVVQLRLNGANSETLLKRVETLNFTTANGEGVIAVRAQPEGVTIPAAIQAEAPHQAGPM